MDISRINYQPVLVETLTSRAGKGSTTAPSGGDQSTSARAGNAAAAEAQDISRIDYVKKALQDLLVDFPPWFPPGAPQRADLITKIRNVQEQIVKSPAADETMKRSAGSTLTDAASDGEISAVMDGLRGLNASLTQQNVPASGSGKGGALVNIKI